jgi:hypothetical protein
VTALAGQRTPGLWKKFQTLNAAVAAGVLIWKGAKCGFKGGYLYPWTDNDPELAHPCEAIPELHKGGGDGTKVDNTDGADGAVYCEVDFGAEKTCMLMVNDTDAPITQANIGGDAWGLDDQTVTAAPGTRSRLGTPWFLYGSNTFGFRQGVYVEFDGESGGSGESPAVSGIFVRNLIVGNIADLTAYTVAASSLVNDNVLGVEGDVVALVGQTTGAQNGFYKIGEVTAGVAALTRDPRFPIGATLPNGLTFEVQAGGFYIGKSVKSFSTQSGGWKVGTHDPVFYPRQYTQKVTLAAGTYTIGVGSTATPDEPLLLWTTNNVQLTEDTPGGTAGTNKLTAPTASRITGKSGTARVIVNSTVDAGTVAGSDTATVDVLITNG